MSLPLLACIVTGILSNVYPVKVVTTEGKFMLSCIVRVTRSDLQLILKEEMRKLASGLFSVLRLYVGGKHGAEGSGGAVARALASHHVDPGLIPGGFTPGFSHVGIVLDDAACRWVFSGYSSFPRPCIPALLHPRVSFHVVSGDDRLLWVPSGKSPSLGEFCLALGGIRGLGVVFGRLGVGLLWVGGELNPRVSRIEVASRPGSVILLTIRVANMRDSSCP
ncbi:hypothetical protein PR048_033483 [Dryococelus australis]|uniref:Uncharacterized protein n=1 Tax=Dryococelus australis TaxID=614101 RepID=A0ABQ9G0E4_9NEOP|nr:hypothetical protein PR048_033483 [Dryococelus australis]